MDSREPSRPRMTFFGTPSLIDSDGCKAELPVKTYLLALFLHLSGRGGEMKRSYLARFLWPDQPGASVNLRQLLVRLRSIQRKIGVEFLEADTASLRFVTSSIETDVSEYRALVQQLDWTNAARLIEIYSGDLLLGVEVADGDTHAWLERQRITFRDTFITAVSRLLEQPDIHAHLEAARLISTKLLDIDSSQEIAYRTLMICFAAVGQLDRVAATFERCRSALDLEFGIAPAPETANLYARLTQRQAVSVVQSHQTPDVKANILSAAVALPRLVILAPRPIRSEAAGIAEALLDDVIISLCMLQTVAIVAPHTSWRLSPGTLSDAAIRDFGIDYVAESSLFNLHGEVRLSVKLFKLTGRTIVWADSLALSVENSAACFRGLALGIALSLANAVEKAELSRFEQEHNASAYYWHLVGQRHLQKLALPEIRRAKKAFRQSIAADPDFAPSRAGQARAIQREWLLLGRGDMELLNSSAESAQQAIELDHRDARGFRELGLCDIYRRRWDDSIAHFAEAERQNPQYADLLADFGDALGHAGRPDEGLLKIQRAIDLNPIPPEKYWWDIAGIYFQLRMYHEAIDAVGRMDHPTSGLRIAAASWAHLGDIKKAEACVAEFLETYPNFDVSSWLAIVPNRNPDDTRHYEAGLRLAGF